MKGNGKFEMKTKTMVAYSSSLSVALFSAEDCLKLISANIPRSVIQSMHIFIQAQINGRQKPGGL